MTHYVPLLEFTQHGSCLGFCGLRASSDGFNQFSFVHGDALLVVQEVNGNLALLMKISMLQVSGKQYKHRLLEFDPVG